MEQRAAELRAAGERISLDVVWLDAYHAYFVTDDNRKLLMAQEHFPGLPVVMRVITVPDNFLLKFTTRTEGRTIRVRPGMDTCIGLI